VIDIDQLGAVLVTAIQSIDDVLSACGGAPENIFLYTHQYPDNVSLVQAIYDLRPRQIMLAWRSTGPYSGPDGMILWRHRFDLLMKPGREAAPGEPGLTGPQLFRLIIRGVPAGQEQSFLNFQPFDNIQLVDVPTIQMLSTPEGQDYFQISLVYPEIGDD
jgi:hypothetical protein